MRGTIKSRRTNESYQVEMIGNCCLINHKTLEEALTGISTEMDIKSASEHAVVTCKIGDIVTIGECTPETVFSEHDKSYIVTLAWLRAFDRAAIRYLDFKEDVYSNKEVSKATLINQFRKSKPAAKVQKRDEPKKIVKPEVVLENPTPVMQIQKVESEKVKVVSHSKDEKLLFSKWKNFSISEAMNDENFINFIRVAEERNTSFPDNVAINDQFDYVKSLVG